MKNEEAAILTATKLKGTQEATAIAATRLAAEQADVTEHLAATQPDTR